MDAIGVFRRAVARGPEQTFAFDREESVSYAEADERSEFVAAALVDRGIAPGDTLGLCAPDSVALLLAILGSWKAGILPGLIDARTPDDDLAYFVDDVGAKLILASSRLHDRLIARGAIEVEDLRSFGTAAGHGIDQHGPDAPLYLSYTSGTTGAPKGAILRSGPVTLGTACIAERLRLSREDVLLATTPTSSSFQLVAGLLPAIHAGASIGLVAGRSTAEIWGTAVERSATVLVAYPLSLADVVNAPEASRGGRHPFRMALSGGSPLAPRIKRDYRDRLGIPLLESYGQSELGGFMALDSPDDGDRALAGFVGRPLPDRLAYVAGADGRELPAGGVGEVVVPWGYFDSYRNKPEATAKVLAGGILHCGDLGIADAGGYLKVLGRTREAEAAESRGGFLRELEDAYHEHPDVQHAAVVECVAGAVEAFVELRAGRAGTADELSQFASGRVPQGLRPRKTTLLETMPRTFSGKANRLALSQGCGG
ncbi:MAG: class I adenylate-forming enzyme family protein [Actinomycetota bacterium]